jgi:hypothetical protein
MSYKLISEVKISRFIAHHAKNGYVIVSACRSENSNQENNRLDKLLQKDISSAGWSYTPIYGGYVETNRNTGDTTNVYEKSVIIYNHNRKNNNEENFTNLRSFAQDLCEIYGQECVLICPPDACPYYCDEYGNITAKFDKSLTIRDLAQEYFSLLSRGKRNKQRGHFSFKFVECCIKLPVNIMARHSRSVLGEAIPTIEDLK